MNNAADNLCNQLDDLIWDEPGERRQSLSEAARSLVRVAFAERQTWAQLQQRFHDLVIKAGGPGKSSSGIITVQFDFEGRVSVSLGAYDIGSWNRHTEVGVFDTEEDALLATSKKLDDAAEEVIRHELNICRGCETQIDDDGYCRCKGNQGVDEKLM